MTEELDREMKQRFIEELLEHETTKEACMALAIPTSMVFLWKKKDPVFKQHWAEAKEIIISDWEDDVARRAFIGVPRETYTKDGEHLGTVLDKSDALAMFMLKGLLPEKYGDKSRVQHEVSVNEQSQIAKAVIGDPAKLREANRVLALIAGPNPRTLSSGGKRKKVGGIPTPDGTK